MKNVGLTVLKDMLEYPPSSKKNTVPKSSDEDGIRIVQMKPAGDVLHIFSHIRKTYRIQWVLLEGNSDNSAVKDLEEPPTLNLDYVPPSTKQNRSAATKTKKPKKAGTQDVCREKVASNPCLRWVKYEDVQDAKYVHTLIAMFNAISYSSL